MADGFLDLVQEKRPFDPSQMLKIGAEIRKYLVLRHF